MADSELILYRSEDGRAEVQLKAIDGSVWLTQLELAKLFDTTVSNINKHIKAILADGEPSGATIEDYSIVRSEGSRQVKRVVSHYNLEMILLVGYRVRSVRGTQFRQWATRHLSEFLVKGFTMDDERLKNPGGWDYFDELLERIREIRASEKRFYQKVRDLFAISADYLEREEETQAFFAEVQNKLLYAVTHRTAAEIVVERADPKVPNMALQSWEGSRVRKTDVIVAKNYLKAEEIDLLNRLVVIFLETAEIRAQERKQLTLDFWRENVDHLLEFNRRPVLDGPGSVSHSDMKSIAHKRYEEFDTSRRAAEALEADKADIKELEEVERRKGK